MVRAMWNMWLIDTDGSHGVHNPGWVLDVIANSRRQDVRDWED